MLFRSIVGVHQVKAGIDPALEGTYRVKLLDGKDVDVMPVFQMYKIHVQDFDLDATHQITNTPKDLIVRWARDSGTIKPAAIHNGEGTAHWFIECMERGGRIVSIAPEYNPPATKSDYWLPVRPGGDGALFLGTLKILFDENLYDADFCKQYTDSPILVRTDTLTYLDPRDVIKDYQLADLSKTYTAKVQAIKDSDRERMGDFMVWDTAKKAPIPMNREQVGIHQVMAGIDPALEGTYRVKLLDGKDVDVMPVFQMYKIHVQDFDLDATAQISNTPKDLIVRWARDSGTIKPAAIHNGEGVAHWFHCTANGRGAAMILIEIGRAHV